MTTKTKTTRRESHNAKRAARFIEAGLTPEKAHNITKAVATCVGREDGGAACCLCDHAIKWLFRLELTIATDTQGETLVLEPVGSQCITDWAEALPVDAREKVMGAVKLAEKDKRRMQKEMKAAKQRLVIVGKLRGEGDDDGAKLLQRYLDASAEVQANETLSDIVRKVSRFGSFASDRQRRFFAARLGELAPAAGAVRIKVTPKTTQTPSATPQAAPAPQEETLVARALRLLSEGAAEAMRPHRAETMRDIAGKGERWGLSNGQTRFLTDLCNEAEEALGTPQAAPAPASFDPSEEWDTPF